jgi:hypothetical protein
MNKSVLVTAIIAGLTGFGAGIWTHRLYTQPVGELLERVPITMESGKAAECIATLKLLRTGNTDGAIRTLEIRLDGALIGLGTTYPRASETSRDQAHAGAVIRLAREYRNANPYQSDPRYAGAVSAALAMPTGQ